MARRIPRFQKVVLPLLRNALGPSVSVGSWGSDIDHRVFPIVNVRRVGGPRHRRRPDELDLPVIELTVYSTDGLIEAENLYEDCLEALYEAREHQTLTDSGYLHSVFETMGMTQYPSPFMDSWRVQGLIKLGIRPPRN